MLSDPTDRRFSEPSRLLDEARSMTTEKKGRGRVVVRLALLVLATGGGFYAWRENPHIRDRAYAAVPALRSVLGAGEAQAEAKPRASEPEVVPVSAEPAKLTDFPVVLVGLGTAQANNIVLVRSRVDGQILKLHFTEGQVVNKGDLLAEIDPRPYKAALEQAQAKKQQDEANLANASPDLGRYQSLAKSDYATRQQVDTQTSQVRQLTAQIASDQAAVDNAQTQLDYATITAPLTGRVGFRLIDQGNIVNASGTAGIVQIAQVQPIAVIYTAPENTLSELQAGVHAGPVPVPALSSNGKSVLAEGKLDTLNNEVDTGSGTIRIKALFENGNNRLWPGLSVVIRTTVAVRKGVVTVPVGAVKRGHNGFYAYVVGPDNRVEMRALKIGLMDDANALVDEGIKADESVVTAGQYRLQPKTLVKVTGEAEKTASKEP